MEMSQLDLSAAIDARDEALETVEANADEQWLLKAEAAIRSLARYMDELSSDDVWALIPKPREARAALGPVFLRLAKEGVIEKTNRTKQTRQVSRHATDIRIWRSVR